MVVIEISFFVHYKMSETWLNSYMRQILNSDMIWAHDKKDEIHRWFSYAFLHSSTSHISTNIILQILLCFLFEMEHKSVRTFFIFFFGSLGGTLFHAIFSCHPLCGASGGIYALLGACIIKIKHHLRYKGILRPGL